MNSEIINTARGVVHISSIAALILVALVLTLGLVRPNLFKTLLREFCERKYIASFSLFAGFLCLTAIIATDAPNNTFDSANQEQILKQTAQLSDQNMQSVAIAVNEVTVLEQIPHSTQQHQDPTLPSGQTVVKQTGKVGQKNVIYTVTKVGEKETSRVFKSEVMVVQPVPEIMAVGSKTNNSQRNKESFKPTEYSPQKNNIPDAARSITECNRQKTTGTQPATCLLSY